MTLDEAITSCREVVAEEMESYREICPTTYVVSPTCTETAAIHLQLAEWLIELKQRRKQPEVRHGRWIECDYKHLEHGFMETEPNAGLCCSECRAAFHKKKMTYKQYCAACGAKMDGRC